MKLKAPHILNATELLALIINDQAGIPRTGEKDPRKGQVVPRPMPQKGAYRVAQMHARLLPEWKVLDARRAAIRGEYEETTVVKADDGTESTVTAIPADKQAEADAKWAEVLSDEIEVNVEPIPLAYLDLGDAVAASVSAAELQTLDDLVRE